MRLFDRTFVNPNLSRQHLIRDLAWADPVHAAPRRSRPQRPLYRVEIRPLLVATIQRLPQRTIESIFPTPGTVSPRVALHTPFGPSRTAAPSRTSRRVQPSMVVGFVSGTGAGFLETFVRSTAGGDSEVWTPRFELSCA